MKRAVPALCALMLGILAQPVTAAAPHTTVRTGWPCDGCIVEVPPTYNPSRPSALLVLLHGDEGAPGQIAGMLGPIALQRNVIVFAPQCPTALGCRFSNGADGFTNSWWGWLQNSGSYNDAWLGDQINQVQSTYAVARNRTYILGWSGGADFMGWYALQHSAEFAAVAFVAGGVPYHPACPATRPAAYFLLGAADPRYQTGQPLAVRSIFARCGDATKVVVIPGADHAGTMLALSTAGYGAKIINWLLQHRSTAPG